MPKPKNTKKLYVRLVVRAREVPIDLSIDEIRQAPTLWLKFKQLQEFLIEIDYKPAPDMDRDTFKANVIKALKRHYKHIVLCEFAEEPKALRS